MSDARKASCGFALGAVLAVCAAICWAIAGWWVLAGAAVAVAVLFGSLTRTWAALARRGL